MSTHDPLISAALLGTARMTALPPAPDPRLEETWRAIPLDDPAAALLQALALTRALRLTGVRAATGETAPPPCAAETRPVMSAAAVAIFSRLLAGENPDLRPEFLALAGAAGQIAPARQMTALLHAGKRDPGLRAALRPLAGERGLWLARRHAEYAWLLEESAVPEDAWDTGQPAERLAWLRQTRATDPARALASLTAQWPGEDGAFRESVLRLVTENPLPADEPWLESLGLKDRRQEVRDLAGVALSLLPGSAFRERAIARVRQHLQVGRRLLSRVIQIQPPAAYDPAWARDGIREKPPQGTGEKAWWLQQMVTLLPLADWPEALGLEEKQLFTTALDADWREAVLRGWIDSARRAPARALPRHFIPFFAALKDVAGLTGVHPGLILPTLLPALEVRERWEIVDQIAPLLTAPLLLNLLDAIATPPPAGLGRTTLAALDAALTATPAPLTREQAHGVAACIPVEGILPRLEMLSRLSELPRAMEELATALEFRRTVHAQFPSTPPAPLSR